jgi:hypothetical protein
MAAEVWLGLIIAVPAGLRDGQKPATQLLKKRQDSTTSDGPLFPDALFSPMKTICTALQAKGDHILNTPNLVSPTGACRQAWSARPSTVRVSAGRRMPSSQRRAVA